MIVACWLLGAATPALAARYGSLEVAVEPQPAVEGSPAEMPVSGYVEHRIVLRNRSKTADYRVRLITPANDYGHFSDYLKQNTRSVQANHGSTVVVSLFQPMLPTTDERLAVEIDGERQEELVELPSPLIRTWLGRVSRSPLVVLTSRGISQDYKDQVRAAHTNEITFCRSESAANEWSSHWLGYTLYDAVLLTDREIASLPADVLLAVRRFVEAGGIVLVQGSNEKPFEELVPKPLRGGDGAPDYVGFGLVRRAPIAARWPQELWTAAVKPKVAPSDRMVEIVSDVSVPVRGLLLVVIGFAVGIGPVNVWMLSRRRKRMWLWWNVPAMSLATCLAVFTYSLLSEGITGRGRTALVTLLDENAHRATTLGYVSYYCPLTPPDGLHFSYETEVTRLHSIDNQPGIRIGGGRALTADWSRDQHLDSGWVVARVPACFGIRKSETRRERLTFRKAADGAVTVVNGLGTDIDSLYYLDEDGMAGVARELPAGAERTLERRKTDGPPAASARTLRGLFEERWNLSLAQLKDHPEHYVAPGCYLAVVKQSPFLEDPIPSAIQEGSVGVIYGVAAQGNDGR
jgi:hypothetical protein